MDNFDHLTSILKCRINNMLLERNGLNSVQPSSAPSTFWVKSLTAFSYLMNLPPVDLKNIRLHSSLLNGAAWRYQHPYPYIVPEEEARRLGYEETINGVPEEFLISEPVAPGIDIPLGVNVKGRILNPNIIRFQQCVSNIYHTGALTEIKEGKPRAIILEIGGGYGGLADQLNGILGGKATYIIVDLPEMFIFQGCYLAVNNPDKSIYIYDAESFSPEFVRKELMEFDFALIPNFALCKLQELSGIDLMINIQSFQEMTQSQVAEYLDFGQEKISRYLYSDNMEGHPYNDQLDGVTRLIEQRFELFPPKTYYDALFRDTDLKWSRYYKQFLGIPKGIERAFPKDMPLAHWNFPYRDGDSWV